METKEKENIKLRFGLAIKKLIDENKAINFENRKINIKDKNLINSFGRLESASGIPKATLIEIVQGRKNAASTTLIAIIEAFDMNLTSFGNYYDKITEEELSTHKASLQMAKEERGKGKKKK
jgi:hypothetical protein